MKRFVTFEEIKQTEIFQADNRCPD